MQNHEVHREPSQGYNNKKEDMEFQLVGKDTRHFELSEDVALHLPKKYLQEEANKDPQK